MHERVELYELRWRGTKSSFSDGLVPIRRLVRHYLTRVVALNIEPVS